MKNLKAIAEIDRPREKLAVRGASALTDVELIAAIIGTGTKGNDVMNVAHQVVEVFDNNDTADFPLEKLRCIPGIAAVKATVLAAAWEFVRRHISADGVRIIKPVDVMNIVRHYVDRRQEHLLCLSLNGANEVIKCRVVTIGLSDRSLVHPREVFAAPLTDRAAAIIIAHNHPSGQLFPSDEDRLITTRLLQAGKLLGIPVLDHVIFTAKGYYSFKEHDEI
ncbi:MAG: DNA repair protein RadC [Negativicutes bacterium]